MSADGEPILARPPSALYRARKLAQRHRSADTLASMTELGATLVHLGRLEEAESFLAPSLEKAQTTLGSSHPELGAFRYNQATLAAARGEHEKALELLQTAHQDGWIDPWILDDPTLEALRGLPGFEALARKSQNLLATR